MGPVTTVIFDLDGLLIDTETLCTGVAREIVAEYGKQLTAKAIKNATGRRPLEAWASVVQELDIKADPQVLLSKASPLLDKMWSDAGLMPGALRLVKHLAQNDVKIAVATSTPRNTFNRKMEKKPELAALLQHVVCGDEVPRGKPFPDVFLAAAKLVGADPSNCLVLEDAPNGAEGAVAAGMRVVVVPSLLDRNEYAETNMGDTGLCQLLPSLLVFKPEDFGLPPFKDVITPGVIPLDNPISIRGTVVRGLGRGSKMEGKYLLTELYNHPWIIQSLGIPTANIDSCTLAHSLAEAVTGIYSGWVSLGDSDEVYKTAMSIGWNPHFGDKEKTAEPWILHDFDHEFYGVEIRLLLVGYIRPEAAFTTLENLIARIRLDGDITKEALDHPALNGYKNDELLKPVGVKGG